MVVTFSSGLESIFLYQQMDQRSPGPLQLRSATYPGHMKPDWEELMSLPEGMSQRQGPAQTFKSSGAANVHCSLGVVHLANADTVLSVLDAS